MTNNISIKKRAFFVWREAFNIYMGWLGSPDQCPGYACLLTGEALKILIIAHQEMSG